MPLADKLDKPIAMSLKVAAALSFLPPLLTRLTLGYEFYLTGRGKIEHLDNFAGFLTELGVPFPAANAALVSRIEYYGAILLVIGLATRLASLGLLSTMVVALLTADRTSFLQSWNPSAEQGPLDIASYVNLVFLCWLVLFGPGIVSLDSLVRRLLGIGAAAPPRS
jgi:putative oxidoreductase